MFTDKYLATMAASSLPGIREQAELLGRIADPEVRDALSDQSYQRAQLRSMTDNEALRELVDEYHSPSGFTSWFGGTPEPTIRRDKSGE